MSRSTSGQSDGDQNPRLRPYTARQAVTAGATASTNALTWLCGVVPVVASTGLAAWQLGPAWATAILLGCLLVAALIGWWRTARFGADRYNSEVLAFDEITTDLINRPMQVVIAPPGSGGAGGPQGGGGGGGGAMFGFTRGDGLVGGQGGAGAGPMGGGSGGAGGGGGGGGGGSMPPEPD